MWHIKDNGVSIWRNWAEARRGALLKKTVRLYFALLLTNSADVIIALLDDNDENTLNNNAVNANAST